MLITQVIEAGIKWLLSLLIPGAGFIKAIMAIKDVIVFFVESAIMLIPALIEGILALAAGSVAGVAKAIEFGLARLLPLVIGLFAKLIGLGGLSKKVMKIFTNIRKRVDKAVTKLLMKAKVAGRKLKGKMSKGKKGSAEKIKEENKKGKPEELTAKDRAEHKKIVRSIKKQLSEKSESGAGSFKEFHESKKKEAEVLEDKYQPELKKGINLDIEIGSLKSDEKDNDVDFKISIAPNTEKDKGEVSYDEGASSKEELSRTKAKELIALAQKDHDFVKMRLTEIASSTGGTLKGLEYAIKEEDSLTRKLADRTTPKVIAKHKGDLKKSIDFTASKTNDVLRFTIVLDAEGYSENYERVKSMLASHGIRATGRIFNAWSRGEVTYQGLNATFVTESGQEFELQFHTPKSLEAKQESHKYYDIERDEKASKAEKMRAAEKTKKIYEDIGVDTPTGAEELK